MELMLQKNHLAVLLRPAFIGFIVYIYSPKSGIEKGSLNDRIEGETCVYTTFVSKFLVYD